jgi:hypothetical protein
MFRLGRNARDRQIRLASFSPTCTEGPPGHTFRRPWSSVPFVSQRASETRPSSRRTGPAAPHYIAYERKCLPLPPWRRRKAALLASLMAVAASGVVPAREMCDGPDLNGRVARLLPWRPGRFRWAGNRWSGFPGTGAAAVCFASPCAVRGSAVIATVVPVANGSRR